jgi:hypothetical protein
MGRGKGDWGKDKRFKEKQKVELDQGGMARDSWMNTCLLILQGCLVALHFKDEETEAQRGATIYSGLHSKC